MAESKSFFNNLRVKIAIYILIGALVFSGVIIFVTSYYLNRTLTDSLIKQGRIVGSSIAELAAERLIENDEVGMKRILDNYRLMLSNEYIIIVNDSLNVVTDTYNGNVPAELLDKTLYAGFDYAGGTAYRMAPLNVAGTAVYDIQLPIKEGRLGLVRVGLRKSFVDEQIRTTLIYIAIIIAIGTLAAIAVALMIITVQVTRPVIDLAKAAQEISLGNFNTPVNIKVKNELQILAAAIERMKESLKTSLEKLKTRSTIGRF